MPWHPPIPSEAVYSTEVAQLGAGIRLLWYVYNKVLRDGTVEFSPKAASSALSVPYETVRNWWQLLRDSGIVSVVQDKGKNGYLLRFGDDWLDWHVMAANYGDVQRSNMPVETQEKSASTEFQRSNMPVEAVQPSFNGVSTEFQRSNMPVEDPAYKVLMDDQDSPPPPPTQPPRANAADAAGGGGGEVADAPGRWRDHPVYQLLTQKYGITYADRLMPKWQDAPADQVQKLLERLHKQHYSANAPGVTAGRMYRALEVGPGVLLRPPARAAPPPAPPPTPVPRSDARAIAAIFVEGRPNGKPPAD